MIQRLLRSLPWVSRTKYNKLLKQLQEFRCLSRDCPFCNKTAAEEISQDIKLENFTIVNKFYECSACGQTWMNGRQQYDFDHQLYLKTQAALIESRKNVETYKVLVDRIYEARDGE